MINYLVFTIFGPQLTYISSIIYKSSYLIFLPFLCSSLYLNNSLLLLIIFEFINDVIHFLSPSLGASKNKAQRWPGPERPEILQGRYLEILLTRINFSRVGTLQMKFFEKCGPYLDQKTLFYKVSSL